MHKTHSLQAMHLVPLMVSEATLLSPPSPFCL